MKTIKCGNIDNDEIMIYCVEQKLFKQNEQFNLGYYWTSCFTKDEVKTNNDHFFNGIRCAVKDGLIIPEDINILFYHDLPNYDNHCTRMLLDKCGRLDNWPKGFFDEYEIAIVRLLDWN